MVILMHSLIGQRIGGLAQSVPVPAIVGIWAGGKPWPTKFASEGWSRSRFRSRSHADNPRDSLDRLFGRPFSRSSRR